MNIWIEEEEKMPRNSWMLEITTRMREKGINNMERIDREEWKEKKSFRHRKMRKH